MFIVYLYTAVVLDDDDSDDDDDDGECFKTF